MKIFSSARNKTKKKIREKEKLPRKTQIAIYHSTFLAIHSCRSELQALNTLGKLSPMLGKLRFLRSAMGRTGGKTMQKKNSRSNN